MSPQQRRWGIASILVLGGVFGTSAALQQQQAAGTASQPDAPAQTHLPASNERLAAEYGGDVAVARPSRDSMLSFNFASEVAEVLVKGGQRVKKGDPLIRARDEELRYQVDLQKLIADSDLEVLRADAALEQAQIEFDAQKDMRDRNSGSKIEYDRSQSVLKTRKIELDLAKLNRVQQDLQLKYRQAQLDRMTIRAPFDGRIDVVATDVGEVKRETDSIIRVVNNDPLRIDVPAQIAQSILLKTGDPAWVLLDVPGDPKVWKGTVVEIGADADAASGTRRVRIELANPADYPGGIKAWTRFAEPTGVWRDRVQQTVSKEGAPEPTATTADAQRQAR